MMPSVAFSSDTQSRISPLLVALGLLWCAAPPLPAPALAAEGPPLDIEADQLEQDQGGERLTATGHARIRRDPFLTLDADTVSYNTKTQEIDAAGEVRLCRRGDRFRGSQLHLEKENHRGTLEQARIDMAGSGGHVTARKAVLEDRDTLTLYEATSTNCDCAAQPPWYLKSDRVKLNRQENEATADNVTLFLHELPIAYVPWWSHPLRDTRHSGFLVPIPRVSSANGLELDIPYYLNIAPDQDATLTLHPTTRRGTMGKAQYRYLGVGYSGEMEVHGIQDTKMNTLRGLLLLDDLRRLDDGWTAKTRLEQVRTRNYMNDFDQKLLESSHRHLDSSSFVTRVWPQGGTQAYTGVETGVRWFEDLQAVNDRQTVQQLPYARLIDERALPFLGPRWRMNNAARVDNFYQLSGDMTNRVDLAPTLDYTRPLPFGRMQGQIGVRETFYHTSGNPLQAANQADGATHREASLANLRLDGNLQRVYSQDASRSVLPFTALKHTIEPSVQYTVNATSGQGDVPNYDSQANLTNNDPILREFSTSNLFATNLYPGIDRISGGHWLTYGVTNRLLGRQTSDGMVREVARFIVGQRYAPSGQRDFQNSHPFSDWVASLDVFLSERWSVATGSRYDPYSGSFVSASSTLSYTTPGKDKYDVGFNLNRPAAAETIKDATLGANFALTGAWHWSQKFNYSLEQNAMKDWRSGLIYKHDCWSLELIAGRRLSASTGDHGGSFAGFLIDFKGLGGYGIN
ncbi:MAG: LPS-assembly protein LptD [Magnetococcales bacterium]|nr:LPS-assembly protein LptD [Magnetococcales bacterium]